MTGREAEASDHWMERAWMRSDDPLALVDVKGRFEMVNEPFEQAIGCQCNALRGRQLSEIWDIDLFAPEVRFFERLAEHELFTIDDVKPVDPDSCVPSVSLRFVPHSDENLINVQIFTIEERERKRDLSEGSAGFELSFDQISVGMSITGLDGVSRVNDAMCKLLGRTREELRRVDTASTIHPEDRASDFELGIRAYSGEIDGWTREKRLIRKDGTDLWVLETVTMIRDEDGQPLHFLSQFVDITDRKAAEEARNLAEAALRVSEARATFLADGIPIGLVQLSAAGQVIGGNAPLAEMLGRDPIGVNVVDLIHPEDLQRAADIMSRSERSADEWRLEFRLFMPDGSMRWIRAHSRCHFDESGELESINATWTDVTDEIDARQASERFTELLEAVDDVIAIADRDGMLVHLNRSGRECVNGAPEAIHLLDLFAETDWARIRSEGLPTALADGVWTGEVTMADAEAGDRVVSLSLVAHRNARGRVEYLSAITRDITELKRAQERLRWQAATDGLTGLPNRVSFYERLARALARAERTGDPIAALFVDLDRFKAVNDQWGHEAGDELLVQVAERLTDVVRNGDTVARLGGDEFVVLAEPVSQVEDIRMIGERIVTAIAKPFELTAATVTIGASVGLAVSNKGATSRSLVNAADLAALKAKSSGRSRLVCAEVASSSEGASLGSDPSPGTRR